MAANRMLYTAALLGCCVFYLAYGEWFSFVVLVLAAGLPWLSLLLSIPAMLRFRVEPVAPESLPMGAQAQLRLRGYCALPMPRFRGKLLLTNRITGESSRYKVKKGLPTAHAAGIQITVEKARICDYLGLFSFPVKQPGQKNVVVCPNPVPVAAPPDLSRYLALAWRPKFGGGYGENHELRLYRPGDSLNQVHWKLTAKTGKLILREPMEPERGLVLLTMTLRGTQQELDRKFGRLLWMGRYLLEQDVHFEIRALTGRGLEAFPVSSEQALQKAIHALLCTGAAPEGSIREHPFRASWQYHIGGEPDEA